MAVSRRDFIGAMVASASLAKFAVSPASALPASQGQGEWVRSGLIDAGGTHEPYIFVVRRGGQRLDAHQISDYEQSEELIKQLHDQGVEVFHTHLYKGFGMAAEKTGMEETRKAVAIAHRYGMKVDTYVQWNTMMYETFFAEEPRATNWIQRDVAGLPILLPYGYQQSFRYRPCFANREYLDYLKKVVHYAVVEVKTDFIHFDNFDLNSEPDSCHCPACTDGFRKFLRRKYRDEKRRERFGFENTDFVNPPQWNRDNPPGEMEIIFDPAIQEWVDFRCQLMADALQQLSEYVKSLNPEVVVEINPAGITGGNRPWEAGIDHARLLKFTESFWSEEDDPPAFYADGRLVSKIRSYKLARTYNNVLLTPFTTPGSLSLAEDLAFNQTLGYLGESPLSPDILRHIEFYRKNRDSYAGSEDVTTVAVLRSYASLTYNNSRAQLSAILVEQALIQSGIPFALIFDEHLQNLAKYKVLVLPNSECLSDEQLSLIRRYVAGGGGLIVTEQTGLYDEWRRARIVPGLQGLVDRQSLGSAYQEEVVSKAVAPGAVTRKQVGPGRVAYVPALPFDGALPPAQPYFEITNIFWKRPKNWKDVIAAIRWAAGDQVPLSLDGPEFLVANCTSQIQNRRFFVHLVNYNAKLIPSLTAIQTKVALPENRKALKVTLYSPESDAARPLDFNNEGNVANFAVPEMRSYALIAIQS
jgi:hypothetical protein